MYWPLVKKKRVEGKRESVKGYYGVICELIIFHITATSPIIIMNYFAEKVKLILKHIIFDYLVISTNFWKTIRRRIFHSVESKIYAQMQRLLVSNIFIILSMVYNFINRQVFLRVLPEFTLLLVSYTHLSLFIYVRLIIYFSAHWIDYHKLRTSIDGANHINARS